MSQKLTQIKGQRVFMHIQPNQIIHWMTPPLFEKILILREKSHTSQGMEPDDQIFVGFSGHRNLSADLLKRQTGFG
jgi:hypothetical protein